MVEKLNSQKRAQYILNRVEMLKALKKYKPVISKIAFHGVETEEEERIAKIVCCIILSEYYYDEAVMSDKTSGDENIF